MTVEVPVVRTVTEHIQLPPAKPAGAEWAPLLGELARQLDTGRIYPRDLPAVAQALDGVIASSNRRSSGGRR